MFETYTEAARKAIFIGVYEAGRFGSKYIELEHLLLGLLRADPPLALHVFKSQEKVEGVRERIEQELSHQTQAAFVSVDLPLSSQSERALNHAAAEANRLHQSFVAPVHLMLGIMHEQASFAAGVLRENDISLSQLAEEAKQTQGGSSASASTTGNTPPSKDFHDLVAEARNGAVRSLIGRERELEQILQILSRRTKNNPVLIGDPGVGKETIVHGLAQRIASGDVPAGLLGRQILLVDRGEVTRKLQQKLSEAGQGDAPILYIRGLFDAREGLPALVHDLDKGKLQVIATGTPLSLRLALAREDELAHHFEAVAVLPPTEEEAIQIVAGVKGEFERFHGVVVSPEAVQTAVSASGQFLRHRPLPDRALDLIDDASVRVKLQRDSQPPEITAMQRRLRELGRRLEQAIAGHEFDQAQKLSEEEHAGRQTMALLRKDLQAKPHSNIVSADDVVEALAARLSLAPTAVKAALEQKPVSDPQEEIWREFAARVPVARRDWVEGFRAYLADCSTEEMNRLLQVVHTAQTKFKQTA